MGESNVFSFNDPAGMCPRCSGIGRVVMPDLDTFLDLDRSLEDGAILPPGFGNGQYWYRQYADIGSFDASTPLGAWSPEEREALLYGGKAAASLERQAGAAYQVIRQRLAGYRAAVEEAGLDWSAVPVEERRPYSQDAGRRAATALLDRADRPTALLAMSDELAFGALLAAEALGIVVPGNCR